jgi:hypothetical protein
VATRGVSVRLAAYHSIELVRMFDVSEHALQLRSLS